MANVEAGLGDTPNGGALLRDEKQASDQAANGTFWSSVLTVFNSAVGSGVLTLAWCFREAGIVPGLLAMFFFVIVMSCTCAGIVESCNSSGAGDYQSVVRAMLGPKAAPVMSAVIATYGYFCTVGALIIVAGVAPPVMTQLAGDDDAWWMQRPAVVIGGAVIALPLMCLKDITALRFSAFLSMASIMYIVGVVVVQGISDMSKASTLTEEHGELQWFVPSLSIFLAFPNVCLSMQCHIQVPPIFKELRPEIKSTKLMMKAIAVAYSIMMVLYVAIAFFGYFSFRSATPSNILQAPYDQSSPAIIVARICLTIVAVCSLPVNHYPARSALHSLSMLRSVSAREVAPTGSPPVSASFFWTETFTFFVLMIVGGILIPTLDVLNDIMGATAGMAVIFILPSLFILKGWDSSAIVGSWRCMGISFMVIGVVMFFVCIGSLVSHFAK